MREPPSYKRIQESLDAVDTGAPSLVTPPGPGSDRRCGFKSLEEGVHTYPACVLDRQVSQLLGDFTEDGHAMVECEVPEQDVVLEEPFFIQVHLVDLALRSIFLDEPVITKSLRILLSGDIPSVDLAKRLVSWRSFFIALGVFFAVFPVAYSANTRTWHWNLVESPLSAALSAVLAAVCWLAFFWIRHRLRAKHH